MKGCEQLVCYISNNLRLQAQMEQGKKVDKTVNLPQEAYFRYSPEFQTLAIHYQGTRKAERKKLGEIFARRLKDAKCGDEIDESAQYRLNQLAEARQLAVPTHPDVREARVVEVGYRLPDGNILIFGTPENPEDARMALSEIIDPSNCNLAVSEVFHVKIRVQLSDRFGRRSQQTLEIKKRGAILRKKTPLFKSRCVNALNYGKSFNVGLFHYSATIGSLQRATLYVKRPWLEKKSAHPTTSPLPCPKAYTGRVPSLFGGV